ELEPLGGDDTLRGFFPRRFLGTARVLATLEYRFPITQFDFFDVWHVRMDGALFGETGRVFADKNTVRNDFHLPERVVDLVRGGLRYSGGVGLRFAVSQAIIARVDVGFSEENTGEVFLEFGHTF